MTHVLVVDDSPVIRKVARRIFEKMALTVSEACDGQAALGTCTARMPDVILLDWNMPVLDGFGFLQELRRMPDGGGPLVILCTTENDVAHVARARHAGANTVLLKPFDQTILKAKCQELGIG
ncbi:response regulator [Lichenifustis flavocetrariae]|uniref:Response regulator n=1 Tax=Lichenifustis flavocetrariae TaxID=2949735 RepID=A0AA42CKY0_9HYPH|nr:response regulator [Lichenifustis flavocetrariae]MCW6506755.1 response regulator [Lichenifustis flavocetrariae]